MLPFRLLKTYAPDLFSLLAIGIATSVLIWGAVDSYHQGLDEERKIAQRTSKSIASEVNLIITELHRSMAIFADGNAPLIADLVDNPEDEALKQQAETRISRHFPDFIAFTLGDEQGNVLVDDFGEKIGDLCRADLRQFARNKLSPVTVIHPGPQHYHYDIRLAWQSGERRGIIFVNLRPDSLSKLLARSEPPGHRLLITQTANPKLIEITAAGSRDRLDGNNFLLPDELDRAARLGAATKVSNADWLVQDIPHASVEAALLNRMQQQILLIVVAAALLLSVSVRLSRHRQVAQLALRRANEGLEHKIADRTRLLKESEARANLIIENAPDAMLVVDSKGCIVRMNSFAETLFGYARHELIGQSIETLVPENKRSQHQNERDEYLHHPRATRMGKGRDLHARRKDGSLFPAEISLAYMQLDEEIQVIVALVDISARKALEAELASHRNNLEELVAERTRDLQEARAEAEQLAKVKSEFLANMSHEIRTPLNAVLGFARIGMRENQSPDSKATYQRILNAGEQLLTVINDILDFSKIEAGKLNLQCQPFQLAKPIADAYAFVAEIVKEKHLTYQLQLSPALPDWVAGDAMRVQQILANLLSNAVKFTPRGSVRMEVSREDNNIVFRVIDTGIGMNAEEISRLFKPFEQADSSTTRRFGGTGLGLAISCNLAKMMGGAISADSSPEIGSAFTLKLPLPETAPAPSAQQTTTVATPLQLAGIRVLAAEDVEVNRVILADLLEQEGAQVVFAEHGQNAVEFVERNLGKDLDVILMDIQMPIMDGIEATHRIKIIAPNIPIIGLTAHAMEEAQKNSLEAGMVDHITKPIDPDRLIAAILKHAQIADELT